MISNSYRITISVKCNITIYYLPKMYLYTIYEFYETRLLIEYTSCTVDKFQRMHDDTLILQYKNASKYNTFKTTVF